MAKKLILLSEFKRENPLKFQLKFLPNEFYVVLEKLAGISRDFSVGGYIEIKLVDEIKKLGQKLVPLNNRNENYFIYLLTHARYEVFTHTLSMTQKN